MRLYLISQTENTGWDTYDSAVVAAPDEETARNMSPSKWHDGEPHTFGDGWDDWATDPKNVTVTYLGEYVKDEQCVICASFNAG